MTGKSEGMYPQADPTAPGGMSEAALRLELAEVHGIKMEASRSMSWPEKIQAVIDGRLAREAERADEIADEIAEHGAEYVMNHGSDHAAMAAGEAAMFGDEPEIDEVAAMFDRLDDGEDDFADLADLDDGLIDAIEHADSVNTNEVAFAGTPSPWPPDQPGTIRGHAHDSDTVVIETEEGVFDPEVMFAEMQEVYQAEIQQAPPLFLGIPGIKDYVFDGHAGAGPSASERWMNCTMSLSAARKFLETLSPNQQATYAGANTAARQGTTAHSAGEAKVNHMLGRISTEEMDTALFELMVEPDDEAEAFDDEMDEHLNEYVDLVKSYSDERGAEHILVEGRVEAAIPLSGLHEGEVYIIRGSLDAGVLPTPEYPSIVVADLKYGNGIWVDVEENTQEMIYALGLLDTLTDEEGNLITDVEEIILHIAQPRLGGIKTWTMTLDELLDWRDDVLSPALTEALYGADEGATYTPGETQCQFCPARGACPALAESRIAAAADLFDVIVESEYDGLPGSFPGTDSLTDTRLGELLTQVAGLVDLHSDLKAEAQRRLHRGSAVPGYQLVNYTPPRKWKDTAASDLEDNPEYWKDPVLVTPTQALKIAGDGGEQALGHLIEAPPKRPVIAKEGDRRKTWEGTPPEQMFPDMDDNESETEV